MPLPKPDVSNAKVEPVIDKPAFLGEGPHWIDSTQTLLWIDIYKALVQFYNPATKENKIYDLTEQLTKLGAKGNRVTVGVAVPIAGDPDKLLLGTGSHIATFSLSTGEVEFKSEYNDGYEETRCNDGKCDPSGRFWVGSMDVEVGGAIRDKTAGQLFLVDKGFAAPKAFVGKIAISNGLAWSADKKTMYYIDSTPGEIYAFDFDDEKGSISNQRVLFKIPETVPDGMTIDTAGRLWVASYGTGAIYCFDPTSPEEAPVSVPIPEAKCITSCCFGGKNLDELYVTSSSKDDSSANAGKLFRITNLGAVGTPSRSYCV